MMMMILNSAENHLSTAGWEIGKKSVLWHQGENDEGTAVQTYKDKFLTLVDKFLNNGYDYFFYYEISERDTDDLDQVREAQRLAHQERDNLYMIFSCANFHAQNLMSDGVHYNQEGYNLMGRQGAKSIANNVINNLQNKWYLQKARTDVNMADHQLTHLKTGQSSSSSVNKGYVDTMSSKPQLLRACRSYYDFESDYGDRVGQNDGTNNGTSLTTGKIGQAVDVTAQNTVELGDALDVQDGDFSVSFWYYGRSYGGGTDNNVLVWNENRSGSQSPRWGLLHRQDNNIIQVLLDDGTNSFVDASVLELHKWYFITAMRQGTTGYLYINGVKDVESTVNGGVISTAGESRIGRNSTNGGQTSDFIIDELSVWDRVLSDDEISYLYNQGVGRNDFATYDHTYPKAQSDLDMNQHQILQVAGTQTDNVNVGDDSVFHYTPQNNLGNLMVTADGNVAHILFDIDTPNIQLSTQLGSDIAVSTGSASGTTGTDGNFTVFADSDNGCITFENRLGQAEDVRFLHLL